MKLFTVTVATSAMDTPISVDTNLFTDKKVAREYFKTQIEKADGEIESQSANSCQLFGEDEFDTDTQIDFVTHVIR